MKFAIILCGTLLFFTIFLGVTVEVTSNPEFCVKCHEMKPQYSTWRVSAHSKISCIKCHIEPGIENLFKAKVNLFGEAYLHFAQSYFLPLQTKEQISDNVCLRCHSMQREFSASGDIIIPHEKHIKKEIACLECHSGIAHGRISHRLETIDGDFSRWNPIMAKSQMVLENRIINMNQCLNCHALRKVELRCEDCHKEIHFPESHKNSSWTNLHSLEAKNNLRACDKCHSYSNSFDLEEIVNAPEPLTKPSNKKMVGSVSSQVTDYARTNTLCFKCHQKKPLGHMNNWSINHPQKAKRDSTGCLVCHDYNKKKVLNPPLILDQSQNVIKQKKLNNFNPAVTTCSKCHLKQHQGFNREVHPVPVPLGTKYNQSCVSCHNTGYCGKCHTLN